LEHVEVIKSENIYKHTIFTKCKYYADMKTVYRVSP